MKPLSRVLLIVIATLSAVSLDAQAQDTYAPGYDLIRDEGTDENRRGAVNFIGSLVSVADDSANNESEVTINVGNDEIVEADLKAVDAAVDEECLTFETTTGDFEWQTCGAGGNSFETIDVPAGTDPVADSSTDTLTITETSPLVITGTAGTDTIDITWATLTVAEGGTGATTLTDGGILLGSGTGAITVLGVATNGQIPIGDGTTDPVLATLTAVADETDVTNGAGSITIGIVDPLIVGKGGTGAASLTDGGILLGSGTGAVTALGVATNGQIPIGDGTTDPVLATITGTANELDVTNGAGTITLDLPSSVILTTSLTIVSTDPADAGEIRLNNAAIIGWEASPAGTDVTLAVDANEELLLDGSVGLGLDDQADLRFYETDANGTNFLAFEAPAAITTTSTCTLENDANPIPDSCVGDGTDAGGADTNTYVYGAYGSNTLTATFYMPPFAGIAVGSTETTRDELVAPETCTASNLYAEIADAPTAGSSWTVCVNVNGTALTEPCCAIADTATTCSETVGTGTVTAGQSLNVEFLEAGTAAAPTRSAFAFRCAP